MTTKHYYIPKDSLPAELPEGATIHMQLIGHGTTRDWHEISSFQFAKNLEKYIRSQQNMQHSDIAANFRIETPNKLRVIK